MTPSCDSRTARQNLDRQAEWCAIRNPCQQKHRFNLVARIASTGTYAKLMKVRVPQITVPPLDKLAGGPLANREMQSDKKGVLPLTAMYRVYQTLVSLR